MLLDIYLFTVGVIGITMIAGGLWECMAKRDGRSAPDSRSVNRRLWPVRLAD